MAIDLIRIANYLLAQSWQIAILVVVIAAVSFALRNRSAHIRYLLWMVVIAKCLVPPLYIVPLAILPEEEISEPVPISTRAEMLAIEPEVLELSAAESSEATLSPLETPPMPVVEKGRPRITIYEWAGIAWIVGTSVFLIFNLLRAMRASLWLWKRRVPLPVELRSDIERLFSTDGIKNSPSVWLVDGFNQPFVWGWLRGSIYLPVNFLKINQPKHQRSVLGHELSHVLRFDAAMNIVQVIAQAIFWFHPLVWWANRKIRQEREKCCDEMAIAHLNALPKDYSMAILEILAAKYESAKPVPSLAVASPVKNVEERIKTMLRPGKKFYKHPSLTVASIVVLTALLTVPMDVVLSARAQMDANFLPQAPGSDPANQPKFTKIRIPSRPGNGVLSPDGKTLAFISQGSVWVIPVSGEVDPYIAGEPKRLTADIGAWNMNSTLAWSGDGRWIAFNAEYKAGGPTKVYVISSAGGDAITVPIPFRRCGWPEEFRLSLSPDGKTLAYASLISADEEESEKPTVFSIPVNGGEAKQLTDTWTQEPAFSPDGDKVAYVKNYRGDNGKRHSDVWIIPAAGGAPVRLSNLDSGQARGPVWSPDGKMIAFHRRPEGKNPKEIWIIPVSENGKPTASPAQIELPLETFHAVAGWTPDNKIGLHLMNPSHETIYSVPSIGGIATQITPEGMAAYPKWSPDGSRIFFRWYGGEIASAPAGGGEVTTIPINSEFGIYEAVPGGGNDISPDGKKIVFSGTKHFYEDNKKRWEVDIFTIPIEGGEPTQLTSSGSAQDRFPCWSPDGKSIAFVRPIAKNDKPVFHIHIVSKEGKNLRHITTPSDKVAWAPIDWSPDGKSITYFSSEKTIKSVPIEGGESQVLTSIDAVNSHFELAWSPNGKELAYTCKGKIWAISREGGTPKEVKTGLDPIASVTKIGWSPDGTRVAFTLYSGGNHELHLMENFLHKTVASANN